MESWYQQLHLPYQLIIFNQLKIVKVFKTFSRSKVIFLRSLAPQRPPVSRQRGRCPGVITPRGARPRWPLRRLTFLFFIADPNNRYFTNTTGFVPQGRVAGRLPIPPPHPTHRTLSLFGAKTHLWITSQTMFVFIFILIAYSLLNKVNLDRIFLENNLWKYRKG